MSRTTIETIDEDANDEAGDSDDAGATTADAVMERIGVEEKTPLFATATVSAAAAAASVEFMAMGARRSARNSAARQRIAVKSLPSSARTTRRIGGKQSPAATVNVFRA